MFISVYTSIFYVSLSLPVVTSLECCANNVGKLITFIDNSEWCPAMQRNISSVQFFLLVSTILMGLLVFNSRSARRYHKNTVHSGLLHPCDLCSFAGQSASQLRKHVKSHQVFANICRLYVASCRIIKKCNKKY